MEQTKFYVGQRVRVASIEQLNQDGRINHEMEALVGSEAIITEVYIDFCCIDIDKSQWRWYDGMLEEIPSTLTPYHRKNLSESLPSPPEPASADEVLKEVSSHITKAQILKDNGLDLRATDQNDLICISNAMEHYARNEVSRAVREKDVEIEKLTFYNQEHQSHQNISDILINKQKQRISELEQEVKGLKERCELKLPSEEEITKYVSTLAGEKSVAAAFALLWYQDEIKRLNS